MAADEVPIDTTGLPAGGTFGPSTGLRTYGVDVGPTVEGPAHSGPLKVGQAFGSRYHIIKVLGVGGMGAVYQAWDAELAVAVALKVIRTDRSRHSAAAEAERRFKNELLLARQVTHKSVVRIHDLGEIDGIKYITMPYVEGDDLSAVLKREGKLPLARALRFARQICGGLQAAHEAGVVHRDLKPANIMIGGANIMIGSVGDDEQALIMDFGISASTAEATAGALVGTLEYMAPEQAKSGPVGARADIYAYGLILYEMLTGPRPIASAAPQDRIAAMQQRFADGLPALRTVDPALPEPLEAVVMKCLAADPAARFETSAELGAALAALDDAGEWIPIATRLTKRMLLTAAALVVILLAGTYATTRRLVTPVAAHEPVSVLIGDFDNRTQDPALDGVVEQTLARVLEGASYISLFDTKEARTLARQLAPDKRGRISPDVGRLIARREALKMVLSGSIEPRAGRYAVTIAVIDPSVDKPLTTVTDEVKDKTQLLRSVASMAVRVREVLGESKSEMAGVAAAETFTTGSVDAMRAYARGQELFNGGKYQEALRAFQAAVAADPDFGRAYALIGNVYINLKEIDKADAAFQEAMKRLDRMTEREKYRTLGGYYLGVAHNYPKAAESFEALIKAYPADNVGYTALALAYLYQRDLQRAKEVAGKGLQLRPNDVISRSNYADYAMYAADFKTAIAESAVLIKQNPSYEYPHLYLALSSFASGDIETARNEYTRLESLSPPGAALARMGRADMEMYFGRYAAAAEQLRAGAAADLKAGMRGEAARKYVALAEASVALGQRAAAVDAAAKATALSRQEDVLFPAARVLIAIGEDSKAGALASRLNNQLQAQSTSYARLITGELAMKGKRPGDAIDAFTDAQKRHNSWFSHFLLGRAYLEAGAGHEAEAVGEFEQCLKRRGELTDVFFIDSPTLRYLPQLYYWAGRAQEAAHATAAARASFEEFLKARGQADPPDPIAADARARLGSLTR